jgi:hypothetical protein
MRSQKGHVRSWVMDISRLVLCLRGANLPHHVFSNYALITQVIDRRMPISGEIDRREVAASMYHISMRIPSLIQTEIHFKMVSSHVYTVRCLTAICSLSVYRNRSEPANLQLAMNSFRLESLRLQARMSTIWHIFLCRTQLIMQATN